MVQIVILFFYVLEGWGKARWVLQDDIQKREIKMSLLVEPYTEWSTKRVHYVVKPINLGMLFPKLLGWWVGKEELIYAELLHPGMNG